MKQISYIILFSLIISCSNKEMKSEMNSVVYNEEAIVKSEQFLNENITKQKLQDYFDLLVLQQKHPEFNEDIITQLKEISNENRTVSDTIAVQVVNLNLIGKIQKISDSIQKMKITFDIVSENDIKKDTIITLIKTKKVMIDSQEFISNKLQFLKQ